MKHSTIKYDPILGAQMVNVEIEQPCEYISTIIAKNKKTKQKMIQKQRANNLQRK